MILQKGDGSLLRVAFYTLGCKVNQAETGVMEAYLSARGHSVVPPGAECDAVVVNTCTVTAASDRKSRQAIRRMREAHPGALVAVCGCLPPTGGLEGFDGIDLIGGTADRPEFVRRLEKLYLSKNGRMQAYSDRGGETGPFAFGFSAPDGRTRAFLKIQDGCENFCAYCVIPAVRGACRSRPADDCAFQALKAWEQGYKELVLTGIEISSYRPSLAGLVERVCRTVPDMRVRLGSLEPTVITPELVSRWRPLGNLCPHFHLSLQSGCDAVLRRMRRKYTAAQYLASLELLRESFPGCAVATDLICGFPGETDEEWAQTMRFLERAAFAKIHIFPYSRRKGTAAAGLPGQLANPVKKERAAQAARLAETMAGSYRNAQIGKVLRVLTESDRHGHSENYQKVILAQKLEPNRVYPVKITSAENGELQGTVMIGNH